MAITRQKAARVFALFDTDLDGYLSIEEFYVAVCALGIEVTRTQCESFAGGGIIDEAGFIETVMTLSGGRDPRPRLLEMMRKLDRRGTGSVSSAEMLQIMKACGTVLSDAQRENLVKQLDPKGTGEIPYSVVIDQLFTFRV